MSEEGTPNVVPGIPFENPRLLDRILVASREGIIVTDPNQPDNPIVYVNPAFERITGYPADVAIGRNCRFLQGSDTDQPAREELRSAIGQGRGCQAVLRNYRRDGSLFWNELSISPVRDDEGRLTHFIGTQNDVTERKRTEETLQESYTRIENILESITDTFFAVDREWRYTYLNERALRRVHEVKGEGLTRQELLGKNLWEEFPQLLGTVFQQKYHEALREQKTVEFEAYSPPTDSWVEVHAYPSEEGLSVYYRDITERKQSEKEIEARIKQQAAVAELGLRAVSEVDLQDLMDEAASLVAQTLDVEYCKILELLPEDDKLLLRAGVGWKEGLVGQATEESGRGSQAGYTLASGEPVILQDLREETRFECPPLLAEHGVVSGMTVVIPGGERPFGVLGAHTARYRTFTEDDVNFLRAIAHLLATTIERRRAEEHARFQARLLQQVPAAVIATDLRGTVTHWNEHAERTYGYSREEALGSDIAELAVGPTDDQLAEEVMECVRAGETWKGEYVARRKDGSTFPAYVVDSLIHDAEGRAVGIVSVSTDITERKRTEEALLEIREAERHRIARDLHDLVLQDLASVVQSLQAVRLGCAGVGSSGVLQQALDALRLATRNLRETVFDLRSRNEQPFVRAVESLVELARQMEPEREVRLDIRSGFPEELSGRVGVELLRVVQEALVNVRRHSGANRVTVGLRVEGNEVCAEVTDDGRGFDPGRVSGGVGLFAMRERMASLGGRLEVRSRIGEGTKVRATIPLP